MKFQIEMTMALATVYGHDILIEEEKRICHIIPASARQIKQQREAEKP